MTTPVEIFKEYFTKCFGTNEEKEPLQPSDKKVKKVVKDVEPEWSTNAGYKK